MQMNLERNVLMDKSKSVLVGDMFPVLEVESKEEIEDKLYKSNKLNYFSDQIMTNMRMI